MQILAGLILSLILGWAGALLINHLANVLPEGKPFTHPTCPACGAARPWLRILPWPRPCLACGWKPWREWIVMGIYLVAVLLVWFRPVPGLDFWLAYLILLFFGLVWVVDMEHRLILLPVMGVGTVLALLAGVSRFGWASSLVGGLAAFIILLGLHLFGIVFVAVYSRLRHRELQEVAFGFGDVLLGTVIGFMLGFPAILTCLFYTILIAGGFSLVYLVVLLLTRRYHAGVAFPYAPFLITAALIVLIA